MSRWPTSMAGQLVVRAVNAHAELGRTCRHAVRTCRHAVPVLRDIVAALVTEDTP